MKIIKSFLTVVLIFASSYLLAKKGGGEGDDDQDTITLSHSTPVIWNPDGSSQGYNVFDTDTIFYEQTIDDVSDNIGINHNIKTDYWFFVDFSTGNSPGYNRYLLNGTSKLYYQFYKETNKSGILMKADVASEWNVLQYEIKKKDSPGFFPLTYYWTINSNQIVAPGTYTDTLTLSLYKKRITENHQLKDTKEVTYQVSVPRAIQIKVSGNYDDYDEGSQSYNLDFGEGEEGDSKSIDLHVRSNAGYAIKIKSENQGYFHNQTGFIDRSEYKIGYTLTFNQTTIDLHQSTYQTVVTSTSMTSNEGDLFPITVIIGDVEEKFAGSYSDIIEIVAQAID